MKQQSGGGKAGGRKPATGMKIALKRDVPSLKGAAAKWAGAEGPKKSKPVKKSR